MKKSIRIDLVRSKPQEMEPTVFNVGPKRIQFPFPTKEEKNSQTPSIPVVAKIQGTQYFHKIK